MPDIQPNDAYKEHHPRWRTVRDIEDGEATLKKRDHAKPGTYLPYIDPNNKDPYNVERNKRYIDGAILFNATARTLQGLMGMLFRLPPEAPDLPTDLEYLLNDADGGGLKLDQLARETARNVTMIGRHGLLVDMPPVEGQVTRSRAAEIGPRILQYTAESAIYWRSGATGLELVVLQEIQEEKKDELGLEVESEQIYLVLTLIDGVYTQIRYNKEGEEIGGRIQPTRFDGKPWTEIPFVFVGSMNNSPDVDPLPLEPLARVNLGHYRNSADLESSSYQLSAATPWVADDGYFSAMSAVDDKGEKVQRFGETSVVAMRTGGQFGFASVDPNTLAADLAKEKKAEMVTLGARLITDGGGAETAEAARIKHSGDASVLDVISDNVSDAMNQCLAWCADYMGGGELSEEYKLNSEFFEKQISPEERRQLVEEWQSGLISAKIARQQLQKGKIIPEGVDLDNLAEEIDSEAPGVNLEGGDDGDDPG